MSKYLAVLLVLFFSGCVTADSFISKLKENPNLTIADAEQKLGKPVEVTEPTKDSSFVRHLYGSPRGGQVAVYFVDNKLYDYGNKDPLLELTVYYKLGLISKDDYRWSFEQIQKQQQAQAMLQAQEDAMALNMINGLQQTQYQNEMLQLQRQESLQRQDLSNRNVHTRCYTLGNDLHCDSR